MNRKYVEPTILESLYFFQVNCLHQEFKTYVKIYLFKRERTLFFRDLSTPMRYKFK